MESDGSTKSSGAKRPCPDDEQRASFSEFEALLAQSEARVTSSVSTAVNAEVRTTLQGFQKIVTDKFNLVDNKMQEITTHVKMHDNNIEDLKAGLAAVQARLAIAEDPARKAPPVDKNWQRSARGDVLDIGAAAFIAKSALIDTVTEWLRPLGIATDAWRLDGPEFGRQFFLAFNSDLGAVKADEANELLRDKDGKWHHLTVDDAEGGTMELFINNSRCRTQA